MREDSQDGRKRAHPVTHLPALLMSGLHSGDTSTGDIDLNIPDFRVFLFYLHLSFS
jgi:hypothetical protein